MSSSLTLLKLINHVFIMQDPPLWLSIDSLSAPNIQPEDGEIWKIVGGKVLIFFSGSYFGSFAIV